jgi:putative membrane protein
VRGRSRSWTLGPIRTLGALALTNAETHVLATRNARTLKPRSSVSPRTPRKATPSVKTIPPVNPDSYLARMSERALAAWVWGLSLLVVGLVVVLIRAEQLFRIEGLDVSRLPAFHAVINATTAVLLVLGVFFIRRGEVARHRGAMVGAFALSCIFLLSYVVYHAQAPASPFGGEGWIRPVYFFILLTHIALAPVILPLALYTVLRAFRGEFARHRTIARWTFPLWLYVGVTGVIVYLMMAPYYVFD